MTTTSEPFMSKRGKIFCVVGYSMGALALLMWKWDPIK